MGQQLIVTRIVLVRPAWEDNVKAEWTLNKYTHTTCIINLYNYFNIVEFDVKTCCKDIT